MASGTPLRPPTFATTGSWWTPPDQVLGRLATRVAQVLSGKHRASYVPYLDTGDFVVVTNAEKIRMTGTKLDVKVYRRHTGYPGGLKTVAMREMQAKYPERVIEAAVRGMLPKTKLGRKQIKKLKVYRGREAPARGAAAPSLEDRRRSGREVSRRSFGSSRHPAQGRRASQDVDGARPPRSGDRGHHGQQAVPRRLLPEQRSEDGHQAAAARRRRRPRSSTST